jgi:TetR/AcrR family transcriptional regulator, cholesterol catabolism regulator
MMSNIARRRAAALGDGRPEYVERRREIMRAAAEVFKARGFSATTLGHVAQRMGVDRASLYYYYSSKEELFGDIVADAIAINTRTAQSIRDSDAPAPAKLRRLIEETMRSYDEHYPVLYLLVQDHDVMPDCADAMQDFESAVIEIVQAGMDEGSLRADAPAWLVAYGIIGIVGWTNRWFNPAESAVTASEIGTAFADMVLDGLTAS